MFMIRLRNAEKAIALEDEEGGWSYGQILAVLIWTPIVVEYFHGLFKEFSRGLWKRDCPQEPLTELGTPTSDKNA